MSFFKDQTVDVLLVDLGLPDGRGEDVIRYATRLHPELNAMVISVFGDERHVFEAIQAGATGYLLKDDLPEDFAGAIELLNSGGAPINPMIARQIIKRMKHSTGQLPAPAATPESGLTAREAEILHLISRGFSTAEVAEMLHLSPHTVVSHVKKIYRKLQVNSRAEALFEAGQRGLLIR
jgi:DNA-binding NarL/FixJ family response regulator